MSTPTYSLPVSGTAPNQVASKAAHDAEINRVITGLNATLRADIDPRAVPIYPSRASAVSGTGALLAASALPAQVTRILVQNGTALEIRARSSATTDPLYPSGDRWGVVQVQDMTTVRNEMAEDDGRQRAAIRQGGITLVNVTQSGNAYTGAIESALAAVGMTDIPGNGEFTVIFPATNPSQNPTLNGRTIRRANGAAWPALKIIAGRPYTIKRVNNDLRVLSGDVQAEEIEASLAALTRKLITITEQNSNSEKNSNNWVQVPGSYRFEGVIIGNAPSGFPSPHTGEVQVEQTVVGLVQTWRDATGRRAENRRVNGTWTGWSEQARETRVAALETVVGTRAAQADMAAAGLMIGQLQGQAAAMLAVGRGTILQTGPSVPVIPSPRLYAHYDIHAWDDPTQGGMRPGDLWYAIDPPTEPSAPAESSWRAYDARNGNGIVFVIDEVPAPNPPIIGIDRRVVAIDEADPEAAFAPLPGAVPGRYIVGGLAQQAHPVSIRHRNFVGPSIESLPRVVTVTASDITVNTTGPGSLPNLRPEEWFTTEPVQPSARGLICDAAGMFRPSHTNQSYRLAYKAYFVTDQRMALQIEALDPVAHGAQRDGIGLGVNYNPATGEVIRALIRPSGVRLVYVSPTGAWTDLVTPVAQTWTLPLSAEIRRLNNVIRVRVDGQTVLEHSLAAGTPAQALADGYPEIFVFVSAAGSVTATRARNLVVGHA